MHLFLVASLLLLVRHFLLVAMHLLLVAYFVEANLIASNLAMAHNGGLGSLSAFGPSSLPQTYQFRTRVNAGVRTLCDKNDSSRLAKNILNNFGLEAIATRVEGGHRF